MSHCRVTQSTEGLGMMSPEEFKAWRKSLGLKQKEAAEKLGLKKRMIQYYETGRRGSKRVVIPKTVELACYSVSAGVEAFDGSTLNGETLPAAIAGGESRLQDKEAA
jgi:transcriptional regulator with XRE-family HTH domain